MSSTSITLNPLSGNRSLLDSPPLTVDNGQHEPWLPEGAVDEEEDDDMASAKDRQLEQEDRRESIRIANRSVRLTAISTVIALLSMVSTIWFNSSYHRSTEGRMAALETSLRILTQTVAPQLYRSIDDSLKASVDATPAVTVQTLQQTGKTLADLTLLQARPAPAQLQSSAASLAAIAKMHPEMPDVWSVSAQLISFKSKRLESASSNLGNCVERPYTSFSNPPPGLPVAVVSYGVLFHDCTFTLDDDKAFLQSESAQHYQQYLAAKVPVVLLFQLKNVHVIYRGGQPIRNAAFLFDNCSFEAMSPGVPPSGRGKELVRDLLLADLSKPISIDLSQGL